MTDLAMHWAQAFWTVWAVCGVVGTIGVVHLVCEEDEVSRADLWWEGFVRQPWWMVATFLVGVILGPLMILGWLEGREE